MSNVTKKRRNLNCARLSGASRWRGVTTIASGDSSIVVSATQIASGRVHATGLGITSVASHQDLVTSINSLVTGTSMVLQVQNAVIDSQEVWYIILD